MVEQTYMVLKLNRSMIHNSFNFPTNGIKTIQVVFYIIKYQLVSFNLMWATVQIINDLVLNIT
jgi:hypothetical protein